MDITQKAKEGIEARLKTVEELIERKGIGAKQLEKAKKTQRFLNLTVLAVSCAAVVGVAAWISASRD